MPFTTELVIAPMKAVVGLELNILKILIKGCYMMHQVYRIKWSFGNLEVAQPVDHVEHCEAEGEEGAGNFVDSEKNMCTYLGWITRLQDYKIQFWKEYVQDGSQGLLYISTLIGASDYKIWRYLEEELTTTPRLVASFSRSFLKSCKERRSHHCQCL